MVARSIGVGRVWCAYWVGRNGGRAVSSDVASGRASSGRLGSRYELHERIETSQAGSRSSRLTSWRAYDTTLRRQVRLDIHRPGGEAARRFLDTALAAGLVSHPALARVLDVVDEGEQAYVVSAWIDGTPLTTLLADGPLDPDQATSLIGQLADGVTAAHQVGTAVGVLRPDHVLLTPSGTVALVRVPRPGPTPADDIRGLGALLYAALTARWPLDTGGVGLPPAPTTGGRLCTPRQLRAGIPSDLSMLAMRALYPDQPGGVVSAGAFAEGLAVPVARTQSPDLLPFRPAPPPGAEPPGEYAEPRRRISAARLAVPLACVLVIGLVAWLMIGILSGNGKQHGKPASAASQPGNSGPRSSAGSPSKSASHKAGAPTPVPVRSAASFNPYNQPPGDDNAANVQLAADGNPSTSWMTDPYRGYPAFGNLKPGSGVIFDLGSAVSLRQVRISTPTPGISFQILGADSPSQQQKAMAVMGSTSKAGATTSVSISGSTPHRYWVVWLTALAPNSSGEFQGGISEVRFLH